MNSWQEYWQLFDTLCSSLEQRDHLLVVQNLRDSQRYVNGLTDSWWDFLDRFRSIIRDADNVLLENERELAATLDSTLEQALIHR